MFFHDQNDSTIQKDLFRNKAVSDGAISFYLDHFVRTRVSKVTYGHFCNIEYDPNSPDHKLRSDMVFTHHSGAKGLTDFFDIILPKVSYFFVIPFLKCVLFFILSCFVEYPSFRGEGIQKTLSHGFRFYI